MKIKLLLSIILLLTSSISYSQINLEHIADSLLKEGNRIYRLEKSVWISTELIVVENSKRYLRKKIEGNISYKIGDTIKAIFWGMNDDKLVIKNTYNFSNSNMLERISYNKIERSPSELERKLINVKKKLLLEIEQKIQDYYKPYDTEYNLILSESGTGYRAYLIIGQKKKKIVPLGNDYHLELDEDGNIIEKNRLHNSYLKTPFTHSGHPGYTIESVIHTHMADFPFISVTDICSAMLYSEFISWSEMETFSEYISTYNLKENTLKIELYKRKKE